MLANSLPLHKPLIPRMGSKGRLISCLIVIMMHIELTGIKQKTPFTQTFCIFTQTQPLDGVKTDLWLEMLWLSLQTYPILRGTIRFASNKKSLHSVRISL